VYTAAGDYAYSIGTGNSGNGPGEMNLPSGIAVDHNNKIYVADKMNNRVQVFTSDALNT
jgi:NHL repeat.